MPDLVTLFLFLVPPDVILGKESLHVAGPAQQIAGRKSIRTRTEQAAAGIISNQQSIFQPGSNRCNQQSIFQTGSHRYYQQSIFHPGSNRYCIITINLSNRQPQVNQHAIFEQAAAGTISNQSFNQAVVGIILN